MKLFFWGLIKEQPNETTFAATRTRKTRINKTFIYKQVGVILYVVYWDKKISQEAMPPVAEQNFLT
jgi:hypothetical protein